MERNYIEKVTNLKRATVEYVPKKWFSELEEMYKSHSEFDEWDEKVINNALKGIRESAEKDTVKLYQLDVADRKSVSIKPPLNVCPYCGERMNLSWINDDYRSAIIAFVCTCCGAQSPSVYMSMQMLDEDVVAKEIWKGIETNNSNEEGDGGDQ